MRLPLFNPLICRFFGFLSSPLLFRCLGRFLLAFSTTLLFFAHLFAPCSCFARYSTGLLARLLEKCNWRLAASICQLTDNTVRLYTKCIYLSHSNRANEFADFVGLPRQAHPGQRIPPHWNPELYILPVVCHFCDEITNAVHRMNSG